MLTLALLVGIHLQVYQPESFERKEIETYTNSYQWLHDTEGLQIEDVKNRLDIRFQPDSLLEGLERASYWVKVYFPELEVSENYYLHYYSSPYLDVKIYTATEDVIHSKGTSFTESDRFVRGNYIVRITKEDLFKSNHLYLQVKSTHPRSWGFQFVTFNEEALAQRQSFIPKDVIIWYEVGNIAFLGSIIIVFLYVFAIYIYDRKPLYSYYLLYLFTIGIYLFTRSATVYYHIYPYFRHLIPTLELHIGYTFQYLAHFSYLWFAIHFLNAKEDYKAFYRIGKYFGYFFLFVTFYTMISIEFFQEHAFWHTLNNLERFIAIIFTVGVQIYVLITRKTDLAYFILIGSFLFTVGATIALFGSDVVYMRAGTLAEIVTFSLGLAYKIRVAEREKLQYQVKLNREASEREKLQQTYNEQLRMEVAQKSAELINQHAIAEEEKKRALKVSLEREIDRVKMIALRAQMKPHFLFNAINSIRALVLKKETEKAYQYLLVLSKLIRYILESSEQDTVTLSEELAILEMYISLEKMRLTDDFSHEITLPPDIDATKLRLPPLILQPFIENAILHGLLNKKGPKSITITLQIDEDKLIAKVIDNGVGRSQTPEQSGKKSMAIDLTKKRISLLGKEKDSLAETVEIIDLHDQHGKPAGTEVRVYLPLITQS